MSASFLYAENIVSSSLKRGVEPWEFKPTETITAQIRMVKEDRQDWYRNVATKHYFYTGIEPLNPNLRIDQKSNPPLYIHALAADYDLLQLPRERVLEAVEKMTVKPTWFERSLGGNWRLVWIFEKPVLVGDFDFCTAFLQGAADWLKCELLPEFDRAAFTNPTRLYCNGCDWEDTKHGKIPAEVSQTFLVGLCKEYRFQGTTAAAIPLDQVEAEIKKKYPAFNWPSDFSLESQGPTFWIPESTSPMSAIVKESGMVTFSAHAEKTFYTWTDILGSEFTKAFTQKVISDATSDIFWDGKKFWCKGKYGQFISKEKHEFLTHLKVNCKVSFASEKGAASQGETMLQHIYHENRIIGAVPFTFKRAGFMFYQGEPHLNTYAGKAIEPAAGTQTWGPTGNFPFISLLLESIFVPQQPQLDYWRAWFKRYYICAYEWDPQPGQNMFMFGGVGIGKTLLNREITGTAVGGYADASKHLVENDTFNSHLVGKPHWCVDDESAHSHQAQARVAAALKKLAGTNGTLHNKKFDVSAMTEWCGRAGITANLDFVSLKIATGVDSSSLDKTYMLRCVSSQKQLPFVFPFKRSEVREIINRELPYFLRWILDWEIPDYLPRDSRWGCEDYQEPSLLNQTRQASTMSSFKELLIEALSEYFQGNQDKTKCTVTVTQLVRMITMNPLNDHMIRSLDTQKANIYLEQILREGQLKMNTGTGNMNARLWTFERDPSMVPPPPPPTETPTPPPNSDEKFKKPPTTP